MKKLILFLMNFLIFLLIPSICYAGDVPETLLYDDSAYVYFGKIKSIDNESVTVIQYQNIKGDFLKGRELNYERFVFDGTLKSDEIYLCGFIDENNPLYIWAVSCLDTKDLKIETKDSQSQRMQTYLNEGKFEEKENERLSFIEAKKQEKIDSESNTNLIPEQTASIKNVADTNLKSNRMKGSNNNIYFWVLSGVILFGMVFYLFKKKKC